MMRLKRTVPALALGAVLAAGLPAVPAHAEPQAQPTAPETPALREDLTVIALPAAAGGPLVLRGHRDQIDLDVALAPSVAVDTAALRLTYTSSAALQEQTSRLYVYVNDTAVAELPLQAQGGSLAADIALPPVMLRTGVNSVSLIARQDHPQGCDARYASELWTSLDPANSFLKLRTRRPDVPPALSDLRDMAGFLVSRADLPVVTGANLSGAALAEAGALVAQGVALRLGERPIGFRHRVAGEPVPPGTGAPVLADRSVLLGTVEDLRDVLPETALGAVRGPTLGVLRGEDSSRHLDLIVTGRTSADVVTAARAFAAPALALPAQPFMVAPAEVPAAAPAAETVQAGGAYRFEALTMGSAPGNGSEARTTVSFRLPPDTFVADNRKARVTLSFAYGPGLAEDSVLNVLVNEQYATVIPLNDSDGETVEDLKIDVPLAQLRPGVNVIAFEPLTGGQGEAGACAAGVVEGGDRSVLIRGDSTIALPEVARVAHQPDLRLFHETGFPYNAGAFDVIAADDRPQTLGALWTMVGRMAQAARQPLSGARYGIGVARAQGHALVIGAVDALDARLLTAAPATLRFMGTPQPGPVAALVPPAPAAAEEAPEPVALAAAVPSFVDNPVVDVVETAGAALTDLVRSAERFVRGQEPVRAALPFDPAEREAAVAMAAFESPFAAGHTLTLVTAGDPDALLAGVDAVVEPGLWSQVQGGQVVWDAETGTLAALDPAAPFRLGPLPESPRQMMLYTTSMFGRNPGLWLMVAVTGLALFAGLTWATLRVVQRR